MAFFHETVLPEAAVTALQPRDRGCYVDGTLGGGGHTALLLERSGPSGKVLAIDQDPAAIAAASERFRGQENRVQFVRSNFRDIREVCERAHFVAVDGVLFDLGVSSVQFDEAERGFSYRQEAPLDMRMDPAGKVSAADLVNGQSEAQLAKILFEFGEERFSRRIARAIVAARQTAPIRTTVELAEIVTLAIPAATRRSGAHPARRTFQALRIAVNDELGALSAGLAGGFCVLKPGGRLAVITFHSLEDRIVKRAFQEYATGCICPPDFPVCQCHRVPRGEVVTHRPTLPSAQEVAANPRARSAKLRVLRKLRDRPYLEEDESPRELHM